MSCCLAWNISLFPEAEQEDHIDRIWKMVEADNRDAPPSGLEQGFKQDLRMLIAQTPLAGQIPPPLATPNSPTP
jgi:hypothetical protein